MLNSAVHSRRRELQRARRESGWRVTRAPVTRSSRRCSCKQVHTTTNVHTMHIYCSENMTQSDSSYSLRRFLVIRKLSVRNSFSSSCGENVAPIATNNERVNNKRSRTGRVVRYVPLFRMFPMCPMSNTKAHTMLLNLRPLRVEFPRQYSYSIRERCISSHSPGLCSGAAGARLHKRPLHSTPEQMVTGAVVFCASAHHFKLQRTTSINFKY